MRKKYRFFARYWKWCKRIQYKTFVWEWAWVQPGRGGGEYIKRTIPITYLDGRAVIEPNKCKKISEHVTFPDVIFEKTSNQPFPIFFFFFGLEGFRGQPLGPSNHVGFTPRLLYSRTHHSPESFTHLKTGWAQDAWLQWSYENSFVCCFSYIQRTFQSEQFHCPHFLLPGNINLRAGVSCDLNWRQTCSCVQTIQNKKLHI